MIYDRTDWRCMIAILAGCSVGARKKEHRRRKNAGVFRWPKIPRPDLGGQWPDSAAGAEQAYARSRSSCINKQFANKISHVLNSGRRCGGNRRKLTPVFLWLFSTGIAPFTAIGC